MGRIVLLAAALVALAGCSGDDCTVDTSYDPAVTPGSFSATVDNPMLPFAVGTSFTYMGETEVVVVTVGSETRTSLGVTCQVVHDQVMVGGQVTEDTLDWYAQDAAGNVWYFGEDTKEYENGQVSSTEGTWEAGVDGAKPGMVMAAVPAAGAPYRQEYYACHAEDQAQVVSTNETVDVPAGHFTGCVRTHEFTALEPDVNEDKYYCAGVGLVLEVDVGSGARTELVSINVP